MPSKVTKMMKRIATSKTKSTWLRGLDGRKTNASKAIDIPIP
ncbi:MAG TPA: hypothetical protein VGW09_10030 [Nitrososphaeraceae archaeon]|nr:hypothetical protein [Nitrososphaeraceae archaeon]